MSKVYIVMSAVASTGEPAGLYGPDNDKNRETWEPEGAPSEVYRNAAPEVREQVREAVEEACPEEADHLMAEHGDKCVIFMRRKHARETAAKLNSGSSWKWSVIECGPAAARDIRPVLGWQIMFDGIESAHNFTTEAREKYDAFELGPGNIGMFPTRAKARAYFRSIVSDGPDYKIVPVYGAYRVDWKYSGAVAYSEGGARFRTKAAAEQFAQETYGYVDIPYRVVLHDAPVPEDQLYSPL